MRNKLLNLQRSSAYKLLTVAFALFIVSITMFCLTLQDTLASSKPAVDLNSMGTSQCVSGTHVTGDVMGTIGYYWESYDTVNGIKQDHSVERIYLIPFGTEGKYIGFNVKTYDFDAFEALEEATYAFWENGTAPEPLTGYDGYIKKCDRRMKSALAEAYVELGGTGNSEDVFLPYYIEQGSSASNVVTIIGFVIFLIAVILVVIFCIQYKKESSFSNANVYLGKIIFDRNDYIAKEPSIERTDDEGEDN